MDDSKVLIKKYTVNQDYKIKRICSPLHDCLGIPYYSWYSIDKDGNFAFLSNYTESVDFFFSENLHISDPFLVHPDLRPSGCILTDAVEEEDYVELIEKRFRLRKLFSIVENKGDHFEVHLFSNNCKDNVSINTYLTNIELLKKFGRHFKQSAEPLIRKMKSERYNIAKEKKNNFYVPAKNYPSLNKAQVDTFLKLISPLSKREQECLALFQQGKSARATAAILGLSSRTVEAYFENIKNKLGCYSKWELLDR